MALGDIPDLATEEWIAHYERYDGLLFLYRSELIYEMEQGAALIILGKVTRQDRTYYLCIRADEADTQPVSAASEYETRGAT